MEGSKHITTSQVDASLGVNACKAYAEGDYKGAAAILLEILDMEPKNWLARYYLAVCYQKTDQLYAAQRALRFLYDNCTDAEIKKEAMHAMHKVTAVMSGEERKSPDVGRFVDNRGVWTK